MVYQRLPAFAGIQARVAGAIYRVCRKGAKKTDDPYGNAIGWASMEAAKAVSYLEDPRPFIRDRAVQQLVDKGAASVAPLTDVLKNPARPMYEPRPFLPFTELVRPKPQLYA
jgi:hypothetical protein